MINHRIVCLITQIKLAFTDSVKAAQQKNLKKKKMEIKMSDPC